MGVSDSDSDVVPFQRLRRKPAAPLAPIEESDSDSEDSDVGLQWDGLPVVNAFYKVRETTNLKFPVQIKYPGDDCRYRKVYNLEELKHHLERIRANFGSGKGKQNVQSPGVEKKRMGRPPGTGKLQRAAKKKEVRVQKEQLPKDQALVVQKPLPPFVPVANIIYPESSVRDEGVSFALRLPKEKPDEPHPALGMLAKTLDLGTVEARLFFMRKLLLSYTSVPISKELVRQVKEKENALLQQIGQAHMDFEKSIKELGLLSDWENAPVRKDDGYGTA